MNEYSGRIPVAALALAMAATLGPHARAARTPNSCNAPAERALRGCRAGAQSDNWFALGKCANLADPAEPFLRIGPEGTSANLRSPTWQRNGRAAVTPAATPIDPGAEPAWELQSRAPRYAWIDFRAGRLDGDVPPDIRRRSVVSRWKVPLRRGAERVIVKGVTDWTPGSQLDVPGSRQKAQSGARG